MGTHLRATSLATRDHTVLPATRHKWTCPVVLTSSLSASKWVKSHQLKSSTSHTQFLFNEPNFSIHSRFGQYRSPKVNSQELTWPNVLQANCLSCHPTNSFKALKVVQLIISINYRKLLHLGQHFHILSTVDHIFVAHSISGNAFTALISLGGYVVQMKEGKVQSKVESVEA